MTGVPIAGPAPDQGVKESRDDPQLRRKCREFEAIFLNYLLKTMRRSMVDAEKGDNAKGIYQSMMDQALAKAMSEKESLGLAKMLYDDLMRKHSEKTPEKAPNGQKPSAQAHDLNRSDRLTV